jgi:hypothetical protein
MIAAADISLAAERAQTEKAIFSAVRLAEGELVARARLFRRLEELRRRDLERRHELELHLKTDVPIAGLVVGNLARGRVDQQR